MIIPPDSNYKKNSIIIHPPSNDGGGPGIGAARYATCGSITFNRGNVTAYGFSAPGIGVTTDGKKCGKITFNRAIGDVHAITDSGTCISPSDKVVNNCRFLNGYVDKTYAGLPEKNDHVIDDPNATTRTIGSPLGEIRSNKTYKNNTIDGGSYFIPCNDLGYYLGDNHSPEGHYLLAGNERRSKAPEIPCLRGALSGDYRISIADGAIVELFDVTIGPSLTSDIPGITCNGNATIILYGDNYVAGHGEQYPGIYVPHGKTVTFIGPGSLTAVGGGDYGVGIGSCGPKKERGGNVEIVSGNITAIGGKYAPALGGTFLVQDGDETTLVDHAQYVYIRNGTVHTKGGVWEESDHFVVENHMDRTRSGNEEFFRWNGELDNLPVGPWIYAVAHNGTVIRGSLPMTNEDAGGYLPLVTIAPDAEVELYGASLYADIYRVKIPWHTLIKEPRIGGGVLRCEGNATIKLSNDPRDYNVIKSKNETCPGIVVPEGATLTFTGDGSLRVLGGENSCAIRSKGTVVFDGGDVHVFDWPWDSSAPIENSSCQILWGGNYVFKRGSMQLYCDIDKNSKPPEISRFFYEDASREFGKGMVRKTGTQEWTAAPGEFEKGYWRCDITWDGSLDDLGDEEQASGMKMKAMSALPARKAAGLLGTRSFEDLEDVDSDAIAGDGTVITGTLSGRHKISIAHGATVTLRDVTINPNGYDSDSSPYAGLTCLGDATIVLEGTNNITSFNSYFPAISSAAGCELTIEGAGNLYASGGDYAAAIGGGYGKNCGSIVIKGGDIDAYGGVDSNVIGSGKSGYCESVSVASGISRLVLNKGESGLWGITDVSSAITYKSEGTNKRIYKWSGNLSSVSAADAPVELTALDGTTITGSNTSGGYKKVNVKIAPGARVTLDSVTIDASTANLPNAEFLGTVAQWAGITCLGDAEITLVGENRVDSFNCEYPCVYVPKGSTLTIKGSGSLLADNTRNHARGAGIGGGSRKGINNDCGRIIIDGGTVHGYSNGSSTDSGYADGLGYSAGIGSGPDGWCAGVEIGSGITEVRGMNNAGVNMSPNSRPQLSAAPIGGGARGSAQVYPAHGLTDNYISTWADRVLRAIPRVDLSQATGDVTISMDSIVTGRLPGEGQYKVTIKAGAEVTLKDVTIYGQGAGIYCAGNASVWIEGMNYIQGQNNYPGIYVPKDWALNIYAKSASDYLEARGGSNAAGIGAGKGGSDGFGNAGSIWIHGGHVVATGGSWGAGIGTGSSTANGTKSNCDYIGIDGGSVLATGGGAAAGIGSGMNSTCGDIYISSNITRVVAVRGHAQAAHIGRGYNGSSGAISIDDTLRETIEGNTRTLEYNPDIDLSSIIGTASDEDELEVLLLDTAIVSGKLIPVRRIVIVDGATVTLRDVTITGTYNSAYNGQCEWAGITCEGDATIILEGTNNVTGYYENYPGIYVPPRGTLTIKGDGVLNASGSVGSADSKWAPGIGGGYMIDGGSIVIDGGIVKATGGKYAAGIGGGRSASIGTIEINGGSVVTEGGEGSPGIGAGAGSSCEGVSIGKGISFVSTTGGVDGSAEVSPIGPSEDGTCAKMSIAGALVQVADGNSLTIMPAKMDLGRVFDDVVVQNGMTLTGTLETRCKISVAPDAHITLKDAVIPGTNAVGDSWAGLTCTSNATIVLEGENTVRSHGQNNGYPGIYVPEGSTLAIEGEGSLTVETSEDNWGGAGIGGGTERKAKGSSFTPIRLASSLRISAMTYPALLDCVIIPCSTQTLPCFCGRSSTPRIWNRSGAMRRAAIARTLSLPMSKATRGSESAVLACFLAIVLLVKGLD